MHGPALGTGANVTFSVQHQIRLIKGQLLARIVVNRLVIRIRYVWHRNITICLF